MPSNIRAAMARPRHLLCEASRERPDSAGRGEHMDALRDGILEFRTHRGRMLNKPTRRLIGTKYTRVVKLGRTLREFPALGLIKAAEYNRASRPLECWWRCPRGLAASPWRRWQKPCSSAHASPPRRTPHAMLLTIWQN